MGGAGFQNQAHQLGGNVSFAQSVSGSQPATPLDLSYVPAFPIFSSFLHLRFELCLPLCREFPSLSNNSQLSSGNPGSMWSAAGSRNPNGPVQRNQSTPASNQPTAPDDLFNPIPSSRVQPNQGLSPFSTRMRASATSQAQMSGMDHLAASSRAAKSKPGAERVANKSHQLGFGPQNTGPTHVQAYRGNGLLNALSANSRANEARSPIGAPSSGNTTLPFDFAAC